MGCSHLFRGHADVEWQLIPSLYRADNRNYEGKTVEDAFDMREQRAIDMFFDQGLAFLPSVVRSYYSDRILAQHFGVQTRLLDWTRDPLVALYFALEHWRSNSDAAIYMVFPGVWCSINQQRNIGTSEVLALNPPAIDRRISAQKSVFTIHNYGHKVEQFLPLDVRDNIGNNIGVKGGSTQGFAKIMIPHKFKGYLYTNLLNFGIDKRSLFPGLDGVGSDVAARGSIGYLW